jgi:uncharacterized repeat protein (TIGR03837 family)
MPAALPNTPHARRWDIFCRVIDNFGDIGVCWRLSADLAARGQAVRLWVDDASALAWMAPQGAAGVEVKPWLESENVWNDCVGDVVIEAFGCELPPAFLETLSKQMAAQKKPPVWINLEYLSAEPYVERCHGLPSPQLSGPAAGLVKHFFYPGFTAATGGLLREPSLLDRQALFNPQAWLTAVGIHGTQGQRLVSLFAYNNPALPELLRSLSEEPTRLIVTAGHHTHAVAQWFAAHGQQHPLLEPHWLPPLTQTDYDLLLWACDLNLVRGEDSFVRASWAARPFLWQIYPQEDGAHGPKLMAFLDQFLATADPALRHWVCHLHQVWNGLLPTSNWPPSHAAPTTAWAEHCRDWSEQLGQQDDLCTQLLRFVGHRLARV